MTYGIPYKGNKSKIARSILDNLPAGKRLVDLFGGGFAITHCAMTEYPQKWDSFLYNDINPLLIPLITDVINGKYNLDNFVPEWISRERFKAEKEQNGYIKWMWSFGNNGTEYLYGKNIEELKHKAHDFICNGIESDITKGITLQGKTIRDRRLEWQRKVGKLQLERIQHLTSLERIDSMSSLKGTATLSQLEMTCMDYHDYQYTDGDVVYCDIPYKSDSRKDAYQANGKVPFNHDDFIAWAKVQPFDVYFSEYSEFEIIWNRKIKTSMGTGNSASRVECLFKA